MDDRGQKLSSTGGLRRIPTVRLRIMSRVLTADQVDEYRKGGLLFPLSALNDEEVVRFRSYHDELDRLLGGNPRAQQKGELHLHYKWVCDLATHPNILDAVEDIIGHNILIHSSTFFVKYPGDQKFLSWHQDSHYWRLSEPRLVSAWIALTESTVQNGCLRVLPGTHTRRYAHIEELHKNNILSKGLTVSESLDVERAVDVELHAGEMSFHHADIVHGSKPNTSTGPRIGFAVRYVAAGVRQEKPHHVVILARGRDPDQHYEIQKKPIAGLEEGLVAHRKFEGERGNVF
jgi:non-haem Fe2+, alpha-ketoglutarate-dependent halogenase